MGKRIREKYREKMIEMYLDGYKTYKIAKAVGFSEPTVNRTVQAYRLAAAGDIDGLVRACEHNGSLLDWLKHKYGISEKDDQLTILPEGDAETENGSCDIGDVLEQLKMVVDVGTKILSAINSLADYWR